MKIAEEGPYAAGSNENRPRSASTVSKALATLEVLCKADDALGVSAIACALDLDKGNTHRLLSTLIDLGFVSRIGDDGKYAPTLKVWELGSAVIARHRVRKAAQPFLRLLRESTGEPSFISLLERTEVLYLECVSGSYPMYAQIVVGTRAPAYKTASGKVLLAFQPDPVAAFRESVSAHDTAGNVDIDAGLAELQEIRSKSFAISRNAAFVGNSAVAAPILRRTGPPYAAVAIGMPSSRLPPERIEVVCQDVLRAAVGISEALGES